MEKRDTKAEIATWDELAEAAVRAFLDTVGFEEEWRAVAWDEVEERAEVEPHLTREDAEAAAVEMRGEAFEHVRVDTRFVSRWFPVDGGRV